jgi:hypothetical protein
MWTDERTGITFFYVFTLWLEHTKRVHNVNIIIICETFFKYRIFN